MSSKNIPESKNNLHLNLMKSFGAKKFKLLLYIIILALKMLLTAAVIVNQSRFFFDHDLLSSRIAFFINRVQCI